MKSSTQTLISALQILASDIKTEDGIINACLLEAAERLRELSEELEDCHQLNKDTFEIFYGQE
jgi:hypothetical protein